MDFKRTCLNLIPDKTYLKLQFRRKMGYRLHVDRPVTFNEKLQWLKLYDHRPEYTTMVDKHAGKDYIAKIAGESYVIPTIDVWEQFEQIEFDQLPDKFVLKCTHDSGGLVICRDKSALDIEAAKKKINASLKRNYYHGGREWPYKDVPPRIIAEIYLENASGEALTEYKIFCFNGEPKLVLVCKGEAHGSGRTNDYCDLDMNLLPFTSKNPNSKGTMTKPPELEEILSVSRKLSAGIPFLRVDTYIVDGHVYVGELTFFHNAGFGKFEPKEWDKTLGNWIQLPDRGE